MIKNKKMMIGAAVLALGAMGALAGAGVADAHDRKGGGYQKAGFSMHGHHGKGRHGHHGGFHRQAEKMFDAIDANKDGKVTAAEIDGHRSAKIAAYDANRDGKLQLDEFQGLWLEHARSRMVDHFQFLDDDGDGNVTDAEIKSPMAHMAQRLDRNDDGVVSRDEIKPRKKWYHKFSPWHDDDDDDDDDDRRKRN